MILDPIYHITRHILDVILGGHNSSLQALNRQYTKTKSSDRGDQINTADDAYAKKANNEGVFF